MTSTLKRRSHVSCCIQQIEDTSEWFGTQYTGKQRLKIAPSFLFTQSILKLWSNWDTHEPESDNNGTQNANVTVHPADSQWTLQSQHVDSASWADIYSFIPPVTSRSWTGTISLCTVWNQTCEHITNKKEHHIKSDIRCETPRAQESHPTQRCIKIHVRPDTIFIWLPACWARTGRYGMRYSLDKKTTSGVQRQISEGSGEQGVQWVDGAAFPSCCGGNLAPNKLLEPSSWLCRRVETIH